MNPPVSPFGFYMTVKNSYKRNNKYNNFKFHKYVYYDRNVLNIYILSTNINIKRLKEIQNIPERT